VVQRDFDIQISWPIETKINYYFTIEHLLELWLMTVSGSIEYNAAPARRKNRPESE